MQPLTAWKCDACLESITDVKDGHVVWRVEREPYRSYDFKIIHRGRCDPGQAFVNSYALEVFLGPEGLTMLLSWVANAGIMRPERQSIREVDNLEEWADLVRRVQVPWYEEARDRLRDSDIQEWLSDGNEYYPYLPEVLEKIANGTLGK